VAALRDDRHRTRRKQRWRRDTWWHVRIFSRSTLVPKHTLSTPPPRPVALAPQLVLAGFPTEARHRR